MNHHQRCLINVFRDTLHSDEEPPSSVKYAGLLRDFTPTAKYNTHISVVNEDCLNETLKFSEGRVGLLNMASDMSPGGGVKKGSRAQEEEICRRTNLYKSLASQAYPLGSLDIIYSPDIAVLKTVGYTRIPNAPRIDVLSMPALRRPALTRSGGYYEPAERIMSDKVRMLLQTAHYHGIDHLVLGAWGCGAFHNPPLQVASLFKDRLRGEFAGVFKHVVFAILEHDPQEPLGRAFKQVIL